MCQDGIGSNLVEISSPLIIKLFNETCVPLYFEIKSISENFAGFVHKMRLGAHVVLFLSLSECYFMRVR